ncbi:hypothetical protein CLV62_12041 [Dysgonomonas alginatilytica]|uniref:Uncharacterized protein n=1 Tax=Dysgonomonas alginatilytica TaxID=1605892 RepID=A0A2V3PN97_9BACT|nr:hypothetical protein CLV62_12041 [Dysgonomonas alginatilytica]
MTNMFGFSIAIRYLYYCNNEMVNDYIIALKADLLLSVTRINAYVSATYKADGKHRVSVAA